MSGFSPFFKKTVRSIISPLRQQKKQVAYTLVSFAADGDGGDVTSLTQPQRPQADATAGAGDGNRPVAGGVQGRSKQQAKAIDRESGCYAGGARGHRRQAVPGAGERQQYVAPEALLFGPAAVPVFAAAVSCPGNRAAIWQAVVAAAENNARPIDTRRHR